MFVSKIKKLNWKYSFRSSKLRKYIQGNPNAKFIPLYRFGVWSILVYDVFICLLDLL